MNSRTFPNAYQPEALYNGSEEAPSGCIEWISWKTLPPTPHATSRVLWLRWASWRKSGGKHCHPDSPLDPRAQHPVQWLDTMEMDTCRSPIPAAPSEHPENLQNCCPNGQKAIFAHITYPTKLLITALSCVFIKYFQKDLPIWDWQTSLWGDHSKNFNLHFANKELKALWNPGPKTPDYPVCSMP